LETNLRRRSVAAQPSSAISSINALCAPTFIHGPAVPEPSPHLAEIWMLTMSDDERSGLRSDCLDESSMTSVLKGHFGSLGLANVTRLEWR
jgi:hypothetical protein